MGYIWMVDGKKLKQKRGDRSLREIVRAASGTFTESALWAWEQGRYKPSIKNTLVLMGIYECDLEEISTKVVLKT